MREAAAALIQKATRDDLSKAVVLLKESAGLFQQNQSGTDAAQTYVRVGEIYSVWSNYRDSLDMYDKSLALASDSDIDLRCSILSHKARAYVDLSDDAKALEISNQAIALSERTSNPKAKGEALEALGYASGTKNPPKALEAFLGAANLFRTANDVDGEARAFLGAGIAYFHDGGALEDSRKACDEALRLWTSINNQDGMAQVHQVVGLILNTKGELQEAMKNYNQALAIFQKVGDRDHEATVLNGLGGASREIGNYEDSLQYYTKAKTIFSQVRDRRGEIAAIDGAAKAKWALNRRDNQIEQLNTIKLRMAKQLGYPRFEASAFWGLADVSVLRGDYKKAEYLYLKALFLYRAKKHAIGEADVLIRLGHLYSEQERDEKAISCLRQALEIVQRMEQTSQIARAHFEIANIYGRLRRLEDAKNEIEMVLNIIESQRTKVSDFDDRASYFASVHEYYQLYIEVLMQLDKQDPNKGFAQRALEAAEKSKVRSLLDMLGFVPASLTLKEIQAEIRGDHVVVLEYAIGREHSYLWVIDETGMTSYEVSNSTRSLWKLANGFRNSLLAPGIHLAETAEQAGLRKKRARELYPHDRHELARALLGPALHSLTQKTVIIVPDGFLQYVPFAALLPEDSRDLVILPSASTLQAIREAAQKRATPTAEIVIFADPVFESDDERVLSHNSSSLARVDKPSIANQESRGILGSASIPRLPKSHDEGQAIADTFGKRAYLREGFDANRKTALAILRRYRFIHFATHGFLDTHRPKLSGLVLSMVDINGKAQDGYLRLKDIYQLNLSADLVVLSACESALGKDMESEGMIGLTRAFLYAGSSRVISTLWKVNDQATAELMKNFYLRLSKGESPSRALRGAQRDLAKNPDWSSPYFWAAFVLQGEYRWTKQNGPKTGAAQAKALPHVGQ